MGDKVTPEITRLIHENFWIILSFAFGQPAAVQILNKHFGGEWKYLRKSIYENAEKRAERALLEMASQLCALDNDQNLSEYYRRGNWPPIGIVIQADDTQTDLHFRDMTNKILRGIRFEWVLGTDNPKVIIHSNQTDRWKSPALRIIAFMVPIGNLMF